MIDTCAGLGIRPIIGRTERTIINMADVLSRASRGEKIGVMAVQYGPGAENAFGGVARAYADSTPIIVLTGSYKPYRLGITRMFDAVENYRAITKWAAQISSVATIPDRMRLAFSLAGTSSRRDCSLDSRQIWTESYTRNWCSPENKTLVLRSPHAGPAGWPARGYNGRSLRFHEPDKSPNDATRLRLRSMSA